MAQITAGIAVCALIAIGLRLLEAAPRSSHSPMLDAGFQSAGADHCRRKLTVK